MCGDQIRHKRRVKFVIIEKNHANVAQLPLEKNVRLKNEKRTTVRYIFVISN